MSILSGPVNAYNSSTSSIEQHEPVSSCTSQTCYSLSCASKHSAGKYCVLIGVVFQCNLPFSLEVQGVCWASVWVALSSLLWAQQWPAVFLHDTSDFQLRPFNSHHLTRRKYVIKSNQKVSQRNHKTFVQYSCSLKSFVIVLQTLLYCFWFVNMIVYHSGRHWFSITSAYCENQPVETWKLGNP